MHVTYFTAVVDDAGKVRYHGDIYGLDRRVATALEGRSVNLAVASAEPEPALKTPSQRQQRVSAKTRKKPSQAGNFFASLFGN